MRTTIANRRTVFGVRWFAAIRSSNNFRLASSARSVRFTSSGKLRFGGDEVLRTLAPPREGADSITREAYSHEVISAGFWPGNGGFGDAVFYCYAAPAPEGLDKAAIRPATASYNTALGEFILKYDDLRAGRPPMAPSSNSCRVHTRRQQIWLVGSESLERGTQSR